MDPQEPAAVAGPTTRPPAGFGLILAVPVGSSSPFAVGCVLSAVYAFLAGAWLFGVIELVWAAVALRRWSNPAAIPEPNGAIS